MASQWRSSAPTTAAAASTRSSSPTASRLLGMGLLPRHALRVPPSGWRDRTGCFTPSACTGAPPHGSPACTPKVAVAAAVGLGVPRSIPTRRGSARNGPRPPARPSRGSSAQPQTCSLRASRPRTAGSCPRASTLVASASILAPASRAGRLTSARHMSGCPTLKQPPHRCHRLRYRLRPRLARRRLLSHRVCRHCNRTLRRRL
mmetsp:Transcript_46941/g.100197  ORF Transcript_46941/g.100197 Transcript_46941/m.100197 type:complete len:203 (-) Transcript_46941:351-959(-)